MQVVEREQRLADVAGMVIEGCGEIVRGDAGCLAGEQRAHHLPHRFQRRLNFQQGRQSHVPVRRDNQPAAAPPAVPSELSLEEIVSRADARAPLSAAIDAGPEEEEGEPS